MSQFIEMFKEDTNYTDLGNIVIVKDDCRKPLNDGVRSTMKDGEIYLYYGATGIVDYINDYLTDEMLLCIAEDCGNYGAGMESSYIINGKAWVNNHAHIVKMKDCCNIHYLHQYLKITNLMPYVSGTTRLKLTQKKLKEISVLLPSIDKQIAFVSITQQADKSGFVGVKSQFIEMFGCLAERVALSSLCDTFIDGDWIEAKDQSGSGIRLIQTGNVGVGTFKDKGDRARYISEETFNRLNCTEVVEGDILISRLPEPVGRACIIPAGLGKSITAVDCTIIRLNDKVLPKFFVAFTNTPDYAMQIKKVLSGTTRLRVSRANLGKIQVPLPSIDKQQQFVTIAEQADKSGYYN